MLWFGGAFYTPLKSAKNYGFYSYSYLTLGKNNKTHIFTIKSYSKELYLCPSNSGSIKDEKVRLLDNR
jgi:hypothetical protein